jgi:hypothetical protein
MRRLNLENKNVPFEIPCDNNHKEFLNTLLESEYKYWINEEPYEIIKEYSNYTGECTQFVEWKLNCHLPQYITSLPYVKSDDYKINDIVAYYSFQNVPFYLDQYMLLIFYPHNVWQII